MEEGDGEIPLPAVCKNTALLDEINEGLSWIGLRMETNEEYVPEHLAEMLAAYAKLYQLDEADFVHGKGRRKTIRQRHYECLQAYMRKLEEYRKKLTICGDERNSYARTDPSATFMRLKKDYMGNDQLLPAYNIQIGVADEYIAVVDVNHYRSDMDCFVPLMEKFRGLYGFYPEYPVADAGYGSYNNCLYCEAYEEVYEVHHARQEKRRQEIPENPYQAENFLIRTASCAAPTERHSISVIERTWTGTNTDGRRKCLNARIAPTAPVHLNAKKTPKNRTVRINQELTAMHREVLDNLNSIHGALLRMNRSIQAEGTFGVMKHDRRYRRIVRRGLNSVRLEVFRVSIGHNLYKLCSKTMKKLFAA